MATSETKAESIDIETWKAWCETGRRTELIDVRSASEFAAGHLPGAVNIPLEQIELRTSDLAMDRPIVLVCQGGTRARMAEELLVGRGRELIVLEGGTKAWIDAGNPVVRSTVARWALERQVRLIAGLLVITGVLLGVLVSDWWLGLSAFVGCGLVFAGFTGLCPMGEALARLPWNRTKAAGAGQQAAGVSCACRLP